MSDWRAIPGCEGFYEAHPDGLVRSVDRVVKGRCLRGKILKPTLVGPKRRQYFAVRLSMSGKKMKLRLGYAIAITFIGPKPTGYLVCHKNDDQFNNRLTNLMYGTPSQNIAHISGGEGVEEISTHAPDIPYDPKWFCNFAGVSRRSLKRTFGAERRKIMKALRILKNPTTEQARRYVDRYRR